MSWDSKLPNKTLVPFHAKIGWFSRSVWFGEKNTWSSEIVRNNNTNCRTILSDVIQEKSRCISIWLTKHNSVSTTDLRIYVNHSIRFQNFFVQGFRIVIDSWKFSLLLLYILRDEWPIFMISGSNEQLQQELEYTLLKPDCYSWWFSKRQSWCEGTL